MVMGYKKCGDQEKYGDLSYAVHKHEGMLHFMLLAVVYKEIGIPTNKIKSALFEANSRLAVSTVRLFEGPR